MHFIQIIKIILFVLYNKLKIRIWKRFWMSSLSSLLFFLSVFVINWFTKFKKYRLVKIVPLNICFKKKLTFQCSIQSFMLRFQNSNWAKKLWGLFGKKFRLTSHYYFFPQVLRAGHFGRLTPNSKWIWNINIVKLD